MANSTLRLLLLLCYIFQVTQSQYMKPELVPSVPMQHPNCPAIDDPANPVMLYYPNDCTKYYLCTGGLAYVNACPANLYWSQLSKRCDRQQLSSCAPPMATTTLRPECVSLTYNMHPADGNRFYEICEKVCTPNSQWNMLMQRCEPLTAANWDYSAIMPNVNPASLPCATAPLTPTMPYSSTSASTYNTPTGAWPATTSLLPQSPFNAAPTTFQSQFPVNNSTLADSICQSSQQIYVSYPGDCNKFIHCDYKPFVKSCPPFLYWNSKLSTCDKVCI